ncbi:MAG: thiamine-phosphate kinase [Pseudomonadota bacterium]
MASEFDVIRRYFQEATAARDDVILGIGDDCALLRIPPGQQLAVSMDTLVAGRHFVADANPTNLGHKALAVNLSDLAAMGATPAWVTLSLTLPAADTTWLTHFMQGFSALAATYQVQLIGGDTTRGPLSITVQAHGYVPPDQALRRAGARVGDNIYVSGTLGDAGLALAAQQGRYPLDAGARSSVQPHLDRPTPRVALGCALRQVAHAAIDISDGLGADLQHICTASGVVAQILAQHLPLSATVRAYIEQTQDWQLPVSAGDDYELLFTAARADEARIRQIARDLAVPVNCIGEITAAETMVMVLPDGTRCTPGAGYDHFADLAEVCQNMQPDT